jgi:hypothetical protein
MPRQSNLFTGGLSLTLRSWPALVWTYLFNVGLAVLFTLPLHSQLARITAHSLASQRLIGAFDLGALAGVIGKLSQGPGPATMSSYFSTPIFLVLYFLIVPGTLFCYQTGTSARISALLANGFAYFWRFVRITLVTVVISGAILGGLFALQKLWSAYLDKRIVGRPGFLLETAGLAVIGLVAALLRVYFDLVQVYTVQLGMQAPPAGEQQKRRRERHIRRTLKPAWKALFGNFFRTYLVFVLLAILGFAAVMLTARATIHSLAQPRAWPLFLLGQLGLFLMLLTRFWQRGAETILALDNPVPLLPALVPEVSVPETLPPAAAIVEAEEAPASLDEAGAGEPTDGEVDKAN